MATGSHAYPPRPLWHGTAMPFVYERHCRASRQCSACVRSRLFAHWYRRLNEVFRMLHDLAESMACHANPMGTNLRSMGNRISAFSAGVRTRTRYCVQDSKWRGSEISRHGSGCFIERAYWKWLRRVLAEKHDNARFPGKITDTSQSTTRHNAFGEMLRQEVRNVSENSFPVVSREAEVRFRITLLRRLDLPLSREE